MKTRILSLFLLLFTFSLVFGEFNPNIKQALNENAKRVYVVSHRADWRNAPENSIKAIENCIAMGVDMVEIDLKKTKDGHLIVMHDKTIDRTTTGKGKPEDYTLAEIKEMYLKNGAGHKTRHKVPTFEEVMEVCKGKVWVNVDKGYDYFADAYKILKKTGTTEQCIIKAGLPYEKVKNENGDVLNKVLFMPIVNLNKKNANEVFFSYNSGYAPIMYEVVFSEYSPETKELISKIQKSGSHIWINTLWPDLCAGHDDDIAVDEGNIKDSWGWVIEEGKATFIQTDRPKELIEYLTKINRR